jgi:hypothetical protein
MTRQAKYSRLENDCFNLLIVDPNPLHDLNHFSRFLRLENTLTAIKPRDIIHAPLQAHCARRQVRCASLRLA